MEIRNLESLGPLVASSRAALGAQGPRLSKFRISMDSSSNLYLYSVYTGQWYEIHLNPCMQEPVLKHRYINLRNRIGNIPLCAITPRYGVRMGGASSGVR